MNHHETNAAAAAALRVAETVMQRKTEVLAAQLVNVDQIFFELLLAHGTLGSLHALDADPRGIHAAGDANSPIKVAAMDRVARLQRERTNGLAAYSAALVEHTQAGNDLRVAIRAYTVANAAYLAQVAALLPPQ